jgi:cell division protein FtsI (penicillin-binding protein 3)
MINSRALLIVVSVFILFGILIFKLVDIQILKSEELKYLAERQQTTVESVKAERGLIYDRNKTLLVYNRNDISYYADLRMLTKKAKTKIASKFSSVFGKSTAYYLGLMKQNHKTVCIEKKAPGEKAQLLNNFKVAGLFYKEDPTRIYHYNNLASHILGYVGTEYSGISGIEQSLEDFLNGDDGARLIERNAIGDMITIEEEETEPAVSGGSIVLTINKQYQQILEEELKIGIDEYKSESAVGIIMDPLNGEIIALANMGDFNPNDYSLYSDEVRRNKAVTDTYEPGSTFKSFILAAILDQNLINENDLINVENGRYKFRNVYINDTHEHNYLTVKGVMEQSSNIGISKLAQNIDDELFYKYLRGFGFGNYTSALLPGEVKGTLKKPNEWSAVSKSFISFGYEISVTPIQLITAYSALVNGGLLFKPQIVKEYISSDGAITTCEPKEIRRVISEKTSERIKKILTSVVENGTGKNAKLDIVTAGGKTGTSQMLVNGSYSKSKYNTSFIGFFPADKPEMVILIIFNAPSTGMYGALVAAPVFKKVAERIFDAAPQKFNFGILSKEEVNDEKEKILPVSNAKENLNQIKNLSSFDFNKKKSLMPDLTNYTLKDAILILSRIGIKYKIRGSGKVISQSISPGEKFSPESVCTINCNEIKINGTAVY